MPLRVRMQHILAVVSGAVFAGLLACCMRSGLEYIGTFNDDYITMAAFVFGLPVIMPGLSFQRMLPVVIGLSCVVMVVGAAPCAKALILGSAAWHGSKSHAEFARWLKKCRPSIDTWGQSVSHADEVEERKMLLKANAPFFRLGASVGLGAAGMLEAHIVLIVALLAVLVGLGFAIVFFRQWHAENEAATEQGAAVKASEDELWMAALDDGAAAELSGARSRRLAARARRLGGDAGRTNGATPQHYKTS